MTKRANKILSMNILFPVVYSIGCITCLIRSCKKIATKKLDVVSSCASPKEAQTDMEEVMGWLTARTPTPECEEKDRSNSILSSSSLAQKHRVMSAESRKL